MVLYKRPSKMLTFELPSTPGAEVWGPSRLGYKAKQEIQSKALRAQFDHIDEETGQPVFVPIFDPHLMKYEMVVQFLTHKSAGCNLFDEEQNPIRLNRNTIDYVLDEDDMEALGEYLNEHYGETGQITEDVSAEGEPAPLSEKVSSDDSPAVTPSRSGKTGSSKK